MAKRKLMCSLNLGVAVRYVALWWHSRGCSSMSHGIKGASFFKNTAAGRSPSGPRRATPPPHEGLCRVQVTASSFGGELFVPSSRDSSCLLRFRDNSLKCESILGLKATGEVGLSEPWALRHVARGHLASSGTTTVEISGDLIPLFNDVVGSPLLFVDYDKDRPLPWAWNVTLRKTVYIFPSVSNPKMFWSCVGK